MKRLLYGFLGLVLSGSVACASGVDTDLSDPLFLQSRSGALVQSGLDYFENGLRFKMAFSYGLTDRFVFGGNVHYQQEFSGPEDGFSSIDLGGIYRMNSPYDDDDNNLIYDVLFGLKFGGSRHVREPDYADSAYYMGLRFGRQYAGVTFAGTVKSTWIFDDQNGMAFIDFVPEVYFRVNEDWRFGGDLTLRKATNPDYNEESLDVKLVCQYGYTQYVWHAGYAFEQRDISAGAQIKVLF